MAGGRLMWARFDPWLAVEFAAWEWAWVWQWAPAEPEPSRAALALQPALAGCCADDPGRHSQRHSGQKSAPKVLDRRPQLCQSVLDSAHSTIPKNSSNRARLGQTAPPIMQPALQRTSERCRGGNPELPKPCVINERQPSRSNLLLSERTAAASRVAA